MISPIAELEVIPIVTPEINADDCDGAADTVVVRLTDEDVVARYRVDDLRAASA